MTDLKPLTVAALAVSAVLVAAIAPQGEDPETGKAVAQTSSNLKQCAVGCLMYCSDFDDVFPYSPNIASLQKVTAPYLRSAAVWKSFNPKSSSFAFNTAVGGANMSSIPQPAQLLILYDSKPWPDGRRVTAFVDGHVKPIAAAAWPTALKESNQKFKRIGKPLPKG